MEIALPIMLMVLGMGLIILDVFVPTMGIMTLMALGSFAASLLLAFGRSSTLGWCMVAGAAVGLPVLLAIAFKLFPRTGLGRQMMLTAPDDTTHLHPDSYRDDLLDQEGFTITRLRPSGVAEFRGERLDVVTRGEMIEAGAPIVVIHNKGNRLLVRALDTPGRDAKEELLP